MSDTDDNNKKLMALVDAINTLKSKIKQDEYNRHEPIAIVGMACRFPGDANDADQFWNVLLEGKETISEVPEDRFCLDDYYDPNPDAVSKMYSHGGAFIKDIDMFDPGFFSISEKEAMVMDPQQKLLLEVVWEALENAGIDVDSLQDTRASVYIGSMNHDWHSSVRENMQTSSILQENQAYVGVGAAISSLSGRISYALGIKGPSLTLDTACSSSLVALHLACQAIRQNESKLAIVGGINLILNPDMYMALSVLRAFAFDDHCKTFDASADGFARGEGCGVLVLKRLSDAIADGDNVLALVRGSAIGHTGFSSSFVAPNGLSQEMVIREALKEAAVKPSEVSFIESHGTGTSLGDPIEVDSIKNVYSEGRSQQTPLVIGAVKTNIGHTESAAGVASVIKTVLAMQNKKIPGNLNFKKVNPSINLDDIPAILPTELIDWHGVNNKRIAGISSFGLMGSVAHVILEEANFAPKSLTNESDKIVKPINILTITAKTTDALKDLCVKYKSLLENTQDQDHFVNICFSSNTTRTVFAHRLVIICDSPKQAYDRINIWINGEDCEGVIYAFESKKIRHKIAFLFTGQGSQYINMGKELYECDSTFKRALDGCAEILEKNKYVDKPLLSLLWGSDSNLLDQTKYTQPTLFALEYALSQLWMSWGVKPSAIIGHSLGEYVAACVAGVFSLEDGLKLISKRAQLMQSLPQIGAMVAIAVSEQVAIAAINEFKYANKVSIAAINSPESIVISGDAGAVKDVAAQFMHKGVKIKELQVSHAYHSILMEPMLTQLKEVIDNIKLSNPTISLISNVTGQKIKKDEITNSQYWVNHTRNVVRFADGVKTLINDGFNDFIEIGPQPVLLGMAHECVSDDAVRNGHKLWLPSLRSDKNSWEQILDSLGRLYVTGSTVNWKEFYKGYNCHKVQLPTYPFQKKRYWVETSNKDKSSNIYDLFYALKWREQSLPLTINAVNTNNPKGWVIFSEDVDLCAKIIRRIEDIGDKVVSINTSNIDLNTAGAYQEILIKQRDIWDEQNLRLERIVYLPGFDAEPKDIYKPNCAYEQALLLTQALVTSKALNANGKLIFVTHGAQWVNDSQTKFALSQAPLIGLSRVIAIEHPELHCTRIDLDANASLVEDDCSYLLFNELNAPITPDDQVAYRNNVRFVPRLIKRAKEINPYANDVILGFPASGVIDNLEFKTLTRKDPKDNEIEIEVIATGLNFSDVLNGMGLYPGNPDSLGIECSGVITRVGRGVTDFKVGDEVLAEAPGAFASYAITSKLLAVHKPKNLSFEQACAIPIVFLTADYALNTMAKVKASNKVLIHAAASGVGMAAIQISNLAGAQIYATVGTDEESKLIQGMGVKIDNIFNSHSTDFADKILSLTNNQGVDIILNSLTGGDFVAKNLEILKADGIFLEIGKRDIWAKEQVKEFKPNVQYHIIAIDALCEQQPELVGTLFKELMNDLASGKIKPIPVTIYPITTVKDAFRLMAQGKHTGKIVLSWNSDHQTQESHKITIKDDATYLITGGLGGLGLEVAKWLVEKGAKHIALISRKEPSVDAQKVIDELKAQSVQVKAMQADISIAEDVAQMLAEVNGNMPVLAGIIHSAGVLEDATLIQQDFVKYLKVISPKILGAINIQNIIKKNKLSLDFFVSFSSLASIFGNLGQSNYAAANAFLDALAFYQRQNNIPGFSVNWGPWSQIGLAYNMNKISQEQLHVGGMLALSPRQGIAALEEILLSNSNHISIDNAETIVANVNWSEFIGKFGDKIPPLLSEIAIDLKSSDKRNTYEQNNKLIQELIAANSSDRYDILSKYLEDEVKKVLALDKDASISQDESVINMGMDSLMAVEFRSRITKALGDSLHMQLPANLIFNYQSINALTEFILVEAMQLQDKSTTAKLSEYHPPSWISIPISRPEAKIRLFCFPFMGGTADLYYSWARSISPEIEVCCVAPFSAIYSQDNINDLEFNTVLKVMADAILPYLKDHKFMFFGHSMGCAVAFKLAGYLKSNYDLLPECLMLSSGFAPSQVNKMITLSTLTNTPKYMNQFIESSKLPASLLNDSLWVEEYKNRILIDTKLIGSYKYEFEEALPCKIMVIGFKDDEIVDESSLIEWKNFTSKEFKLELFDGGHFEIFLESNRAIITHRIEEMLLPR